MDVIGTSLVSSVAAQGNVNNGDPINDLSLGVGTWIVSAYAGAVKISIENTGQSVMRMGINPFVVTTGPMNIRTINRSGSAITRYADGTNYYIIAVRIK